MVTQAKENIIFAHTNITSWQFPCRLRHKMYSFRAFNKRQLKFKTVSARQLHTRMTSKQLVRATTLKMSPHTIAGIVQQQDGCQNSRTSAPDNTHSTDASRLKACVQNFKFKLTFLHWGEIGAGGGGLGRARYKPCYVRQHLRAHTAHHLMRRTSRIFRAMDKLVDIWRRGSQSLQQQYLMQSVNTCDWISLRITYCVTRDTTATWSNLY